MEGKREPGIGLFGQLLGADPREAIDRHLASDEFGKECATWAVDFEFGTVWAREGLDRKLRSCAVVGMLIALRQPEELKAHVRIARKNGVTVRELEELLYLAMPYAGFPAANTAKRAMIDALEGDDDDWGE